MDSSTSPDKSKGENMRAAKRALLGLEIDQTFKNLFQLQTQFASKVMRQSA